MESSHLVIFSTSGKFITKFNVLCCIRLSETLFWTGARDRIPITFSFVVVLYSLYSLYAVIKMVLLDEGGCHV